MARAEKENSAQLRGTGQGDPEIAGEAPRGIILVKAGAPVDATIAGLSERMEPGDIIIDGGNEWYENTERRQKEAWRRACCTWGWASRAAGGRARTAMMPGGDRAAFGYIEEVVTGVPNGLGPCVTYVGPGGANFVKMVQRHRVRRHAAHLRRTTCFAWWAA